LLLMLIGCGSGDGSESIGSNGLQSTAGAGVDYSWARPSPASLASEGYGFAARYLSYVTTGKNLSLSEAESLAAAGLSVVVCWEQNADDALSGFDLGVSDAKAAQSQAEADGQPSGRPIYFALDFDAQPSQQAEIEAYFEGVASVLGLERTGAYGGYGPISRLFDDGKITWGWQTLAWSAGQWDSRAQLRQTADGIAGGSLDLDQAIAADFGQWTPGGSGGGGGGGGADAGGAPTPCSVAGVEGTCISTSTCASMTGYVSTPNDCPGAADIQCCTPEPPAPAPQACTASGVAGTCILTSACAARFGYASTPGDCPGAADIECCTPAPSCTVAGVTGACIEKSTCNSAGRTSTPGFCPGAADIECCTP